MPEGFLLLRPWWLLGLLPLIWFLRRGPRGPASPWEGLVDPHLLPHLLVAPQAGPNRSWSLALPLVWILAVLALAGPAWDRGPPVHYRTRTPPLVIALDLSRSMDAGDLRPSRLALARIELRELLEELSPRPVGLVVFAGHAFRALPLTEDRGIVLHTLDILETGMMPVQGSAPETALEEAAAMLRLAEAGKADILLIGDQGGDRAAAAARDLVAEGFRTSVLAVGTVAGGPIPEPGGGVLEWQGSAALPALDQAGLRAVAEAGGGRYLPSAQDGSDTESILAALHPRRGREGSERDPAVRVWRDRGPWLLLLLGPLALLTFRRAGYFVMLAALSLPPQPASAVEWEDLWRTPDQRAHRAFEAGDYSAARRCFRDPLWRGIAAFRGGDYHSALADFQGVDSVTALYNLGNTLVRLGRLKEAAEAYRMTLGRDPEHLSARHNLALVDRASKLAEDRGPAPPLLRRPEKTAVPASAEIREEDLPVPDPEELQEPPPVDAEPRVEPLGAAGGGAILLQGRPQEAQREGSVLGQGRGGEGGRETPPGGEPGRGRLPEQEADQSSASSTEEARLPPPWAGASAPLGDGATGTGAAPAPDPEAVLTGLPQPPDRESTERAASGPAAERRQALEQWLARIPQTDGGFLREKFLRDYRRHRGRPPEGPPW